MRAVHLHWRKFAKQVLKHSWNGLLVKTCAESRAVAQQCQWRTPKRSLRRLPWIADRCISWSWSTIGRTTRMLKVLFKWRCLLSWMLKFHLGHFRSLEANLDIGADAVSQRMPLAQSSDVVLLGRITIGNVLLFSRIISLSSLHLFIALAFSKRDETGWNKVSPGHNTLKHLLIIYPVTWCLACMTPERDDSIMFQNEPECMLFFCHNLPEYVCFFGSAGLAPTTARLQIMRREETRKEPVACPTVVSWGLVQRKCLFPKPDSNRNSSFSK